MIKITITSAKGSTLEYEEEGVKGIYSLMAYGTGYDNKSHNKTDAFINSLGNMCRMVQKLDNEQIEEKLL